MEGKECCPLLEAYSAKKERLIRQLRSRCGGEEGKIRLKKESSNLFRPKKESSGDRLLDVRDFHRVISVDRERLVAEVEGMTSYEALVKETLKQGCLPTVVPELKTITVGGALAGCGIESSSFRYGLVHETISEAEVLLSDGRVVTCTKENEERELYFALPNTFGTLGYALKVKVALVPAKRGVALTHLSFSDPHVFFEELGRRSLQGEQDFIEGVLFGDKEQVITIGKFVDDALGASDYSRMNIYYRSIGNKGKDLLESSDYIWRWDTDWFWCSDVFYMQQPLMRRLFGKWMLGSAQFNKIMSLCNNQPLLKKIAAFACRNRESVIQDIAIPIDRAGDFYHFFRKAIGITPVWICPTKSPSADLHWDFCPIDPHTLYLDFGFWKSLPTSRKPGFHNRLLEKKCRELGGFKSLYSTSYYSEEEFWEIYNREKYLALKEKYDPQGSLPQWYEKCTARDRQDQCGR